MLYQLRYLRFLMMLQMSMSLEQGMPRFVFVVRHARQNPALAKLDYRRFLWSSPAPRENWFRRPDPLGKSVAW